MSTPVSQSRLILGVDPGTRQTGYALLHKQGQSLIMVEQGVFRLEKQGDTHGARLAALYQHLERLIERYKPSELAVESPFVGANIQSALKLGRVQGVVLAVAFRYNMQAEEYAPRAVKQRVTGKGTAAKQQVAYMLHKLVRGAPTPEDYETADASDALAVAVCHALSDPLADPGPKIGYTGTIPSGTGGKSTWKKLWLAQQEKDRD